MEALEYLYQSLIWQIKNNNITLTTEQISDLTGNGIDL